MSYRIAVRFAVSGDLRFLGHQDSMRLFERAAVRAGLPLRWGQGFNPRPHYSLPLPRPLGVASEDELLVLELETPQPPQGEPPGEPVAPQELLSRLAQQMPAGVELLSAEGVVGVPGPRSVRYRLDLAANESPPRPPFPAALPALPSLPSLAERIVQLLARPELVVQRQTDERGGTHAVDIRPYIEQLRWIEDRGRLEMTIAVTPGGSARPAEVLAALGLDPGETAHKLVREHVDWQMA